MDHIVALGQRLPFRCGLCDKPFARTEPLRKHVWRHSKEHLVECECGEGFNNIQHFQKVHFPMCQRPSIQRGPEPSDIKERLYRCNKIGCKHPGLDSSFKLRMHRCMDHRKPEPSETSETYVFCNHPECDKLQFQRTSSLQRHIWGHSNERCRECTCGSAPVPYEAFLRHCKELNCKPLDVNRTPGDFIRNGISVYGLMTRDKSFTFMSLADLQSSDEFRRCPHCRKVFRWLSRHKCTHRKEPAGHDQPGTRDNGDMPSGAEQEDQPQPQLQQAGMRTPRASAIQEAEHDIHRDIPSETESGVQPDHQPQQVAENTNRGWISLILNSPATIISDHRIQPLADDSGHTYEPSQARSPLQASPTASPYSTNELPRHCGLLTAGDGTVRLASELDYSKEAAATVQHSGHPVTAPPAVAQSTEGEVGPRAAKPDSSGQSIQPTKSRRRFRPRNAIKLLSGPPSPPRVTSDPVGGPTLVSSDGIQSSGPRASWLGRDGEAIHVSDEPSDHLLNDSPTTLFNQETRSDTTLEMEDIGQDQGHGANDGPQPQPTSSIESTAQGNEPSQRTHISNPERMHRRNSPTATLHSPVATQPQQPIRPRQQLSQLEAPQKFRCGYDQCDKGYTRKENLTRHIEFNHKGTGVVCDVCHKICRGPWNLEQHKIIDHGEGERLPCGQCDRTFARKGDLQRHKNHTHRGVSAPLADRRCDPCNKTFATKGNLRVHIRTAKNCSQRTTGGFRVI